MYRGGSGTRDSETPLKFVLIPADIQFSNPAIMYNIIHQVSGDHVENAIGKNSRKENTMDTVQNNLTRFSPQEPVINQSLQASKTQLAAINKSQSLDLDIVTEEGDKVTLSIDARAWAVYASHEEGGMDNDSMYAHWSEFSAGQYEREVSFTVEGDLNQQERREIRKVIKTVNRMMQNFVNGKLNPMMAKAHKLQGLETIDSVEVDMAYEHQMVVAQQTRAAIAYDQTGTPASRPALPVAGVEAPIEKEAAVVAEDVAKEVVGSPAPYDPLRELVDQLLQAYRDHAAEWNSFAGEVMDQIRDFFADAIKGFGKNEPESDKEDGAMAVVDDDDMAVEEDD